jgi:hypothetical protein
VDVIGLKSSKNFSIECCFERHFQKELVDRWLNALSDSLVENITSSNVVNKLASLHGKLILRTLPSVCLVF